MGIQERKERERERRRQQIMVAAKRIFSTKGFARTTMEDIAREAELSPGTLYLYFKNKDELFSSLSLRTLQYLNIRLEQAVDMAEELDAEQKIQLLQEALYDVYRFDPMMLINMFHMQSAETLRNLSPDLLRDIRELSQAFILTIARMFADGVKAKTFIGSQAIDIADTIWSIFVGVILWEESKKVIDEREEHLEDMMHLAFKVIRHGIITNQGDVQRDNASP